MNRKNPCHKSLDTKTNLDIVWGQNNCVTWREVIDIAAIIIMKYNHELFTLLVTKYNSNYSQTIPEAHVLLIRIKFHCFRTWKILVMLEN